MGLRDYYRLAKRALDAAPGAVPGPPASGGEQSVRVIDGDTIYLPAQDLRVRLARIDAPEKGQPGAYEATRALVRLLGRAEELEVRLSERGKYGRPVCECWADGVNVSDWLVEHGYVDTY